ncbi:MAG: hypothetical protein LBH91_01980, partial [Prevotellaceae bacterium]|nr:hypothetical protein [Prevotellaceae bacterium]
IRQEPLIPQLQIRADLPFKFQKNNTVARFAKQIEAITPFTGNLNSLHLAYQHKEARREEFIVKGKA